MNEGNMTKQQELILGDGQLVIFPTWAMKKLLAKVPVIMLPAGQEPKTGIVNELNKTQATDYHKSGWFSVDDINVETTETVVGGKIRIAHHVEFKLGVLKDSAKPKRTIRH